MMSIVHNPANIEVAQKTHLQVCYQRLTVNLTTHGPRYLDETRCNRSNGGASKGTETEDT